MALKLPFSLKKLPKGGVLMKFKIPVAIELDKASGIVGINILGAGIPDDSSTAAVMTGAYSPEVKIGQDNFQRVACDPSRVKHTEEFEDSSQNVNTPTVTAVGKFSIMSVRILRIKGKNQLTFKIGNTDLIDGVDFEWDDYNLPPVFYVAPKAKRLLRLALGYGIKPDLDLLEKTAKHRQSIQSQERKDVSGAMRYMQDSFGMLEHDLRKHFVNDKKPAEQAQKQDSRGQDKNKKTHRRRNQNRTPRNLNNGMSQLGNLMAAHA